MQEMSRASSLRNWRGQGECTRGAGFARPPGASPSRTAREGEGAAGDSGGGLPHASTTSNPVVISAVLPSMMLAEQYLSWLMAIARSTAAGGIPLPVTVKCIWILVNTLGSVWARSVVSLTLQQ